MIWLFTDFGLHGPYVGQMQAVLARATPGTPCINLFADAPAFNPKASAYLLPAYTSAMQSGDVCLAVVDPGVGDVNRRPVVLEADGRWYVGPDNGLFALLARRAASARAWQITWRPSHLSDSFHGRDLFAPVAAQLARGEMVPGDEIPPESLDRDWPLQLPEVVYVDHYGNLITGIEASHLSQSDTICLSGHTVVYARTFAEVAVGQPFWYENSNGLIELALNRGAAVAYFGASPGSRFIIQR